jgi:hypothetical protein
MACCPAGHQLPGPALRPCAACRRDAHIGHAAEVAALPVSVAAAAVDAVITSPAVLRDLTGALAADPDMLRRGAPPVAGRLAAELIARDSATLTPGACARCGRAGISLFLTPAGATCKACTARQRAGPCAHCGVVKPLACRDGEGRRICERCRRHHRG